MYENMRLNVAKSLTAWMNGKKQDPLPDWDSLPEVVRNAYLEQADLALATADYDRYRHKVERYEYFLHSLQMSAEVIMNPERVKKLIDNACRWSYAHRVGNGENTEEEQDKIIKRAFDKLVDFE